MKATGAEERINVRVPADLKREAKIKAARLSTTLTEVIVQALRTWTAKPDPS